MQLKETSIPLVSSRLATFWRKCRSRFPMCCLRLLAEPQYDPQCIGLRSYNSNMIRPDTGYPDLHDSSYVIPYQFPPYVFLYYTHVLLLSIR